MRSIDLSAQGGMSMSVSFPLLLHLGLVTSQTFLSVRLSATRDVFMRAVLVTRDSIIGLFVSFSCIFFFVDSVLLDNKLNSIQFLLTVGFTSKCGEASPTSRFNFIFSSFS